MKTKGVSRRKSPFLVFLSTFPSEKEARDFARAAVTGHYAACVNVLGPVRSFFHWENKFQEEKEFLVLGKTTVPGFKRLKREIGTLHSYKVPELISFNIADGLPAYLKWIETAMG